MYNFTVEDWHNYFVSDNSVLVHNANCGKEHPNTEDIDKTGVEPYTHLQDSKSVSIGKDFTAAQKRNIIQENIKKNGGVVKSDLSGVVLIKSSKSQRGVTPPGNEWQIDHIYPRDKGGSNSYSNAQVLSRKENREKWNR